MHFTAGHSGVHVAISGMSGNTILGPWVILQSPANIPTALVKVREHNSCLPIFFLWHHLSGPFMPSSSLLLLLFLSLFNFRGYCLTGKINFSPQGFWKPDLYQSSASPGSCTHPTANSGSQSLWNRGHQCARPALPPTLPPGRDFIVAMILMFM